MKKFIYVIIIVLTSILLGGCTSNPEEGNKEVTYDYESVKDELIRFHVIANSDDKNDQDLKLKVRDEVIKYLEPLLKNSKSIDESRKIIKENNNKVISIAKKVVKDNGYSYTVQTELSRENFPEKIYGNIVLPQGEYEAYRILIGDASGQNWWCVMFPPLCFVDVTKGAVAYNETESRMDEIATEKQSDDEVEEEEYVLKFKIFDVIKEIFQ
ncbi:MAG: stage II sporulation protein R [Clostridium sp.]|uniref:stage II sporulation protein R n=1 Tax=Clostridium sp. TaxID=1506 RepID=UPI003F33CC9D